MNIKFLQMAALMGWLMFTQSAMSQPPPRGQLDHPSHRYLPPPMGKGRIGDQIRALEELSANDGGGEPSTPMLSPAQLKQLDSIVEGFRNDKGELELPDPQSIPKQWIDSLLPDPKQRQQVKDVLEEYARTRNLQLDKDAKPNGIPPLESPAPGGKGSSNDKPRGAQPTDATRGSDNKGRRDDQGTQSPAEQPATADEVPKDRLTELRALYETLQKIQEQRSQQQSNQSGATDSRWNRPNVANERNRNSTSSSRNDSRNDPRSGRPRVNESIRPTPRSSGSTQRDRPNRPPANNLSQSANPNNAQSGRSRVAPPLTDDDAANGLGGNRFGSGDNATVQTPDNSPKGDDANNLTPTPGAPLGPSTDPKAPTLTPFDEGYNFAADQQVPVDPFTKPEDPTADPNPQRANSTRPSAPRARPAEPFKVTQLAREPREPQDRNANADETSFDLKKSIEQSGLGTALKRIVQKTLKEQGYDPNQPGNTMPGWSNSTSSNSQAPTPSLPGGKTPGAMTTEQLKNWANSVATAPNNLSNNSNSATNSAWSKWVREAWQAVAEAPARSSSSISSPSSSSAAASPAAAFGQLPDLRWTNSMTLAVIFVAGVIGLLVWLSRRRVAELADASAAQAEWVRTVMAQGLKTRGDVVRAFHQLVKQSRAVSDWWTHRSIVKHFNTQTPQLASAINELAIVYEQARYYPEDVELSQQQLAKVRTLLESVKIPTSNRA